MALRILVVHEFGVTRKITHGYVMTEFSDAVTDVLSSPYEAVEQLRKDRYDIVFCGLEMADMDGFAVCERMKEMPLNRDTPFVIMTASCDEAQRRRVASRGIQYILPIPFTPLQLRRVVNEACDPRRSRVFPRFIIPGAKAFVQTPEMVISADVLNISVKGLLCRFIHPEQPFNLLAACTINILFPPEFGSTSAGHIESALLRMSVESWRRDEKPMEIRAAYKFVSLPEASQKVLDKALEKAHSDLIASEDEARARSK